MTGIPDSTHKPTVLLVDDTPDNIALLSALLKERYRVKVATNGTKALQIAAAAPRPDLILLDVVMPGMDGHETCRRLKADRSTAAIPVIFLTSRAGPEDEQLGRVLGAAGYIVKPYHPDRLREAVALALQCKHTAENP